MSLICIADRQVGGLGRSSPLLFFVCFWLTRPPRLRDDARSARHLGSEAAIPAIQTEWYWRIPAVPMRPAAACPFAPSSCGSKTHRSQSARITIHGKSAPEAAAQSMSCSSVSASWRSLNQEDRPRTTAILHHQQQTQCRIGRPGTRVSSRAQSRRCGHVWYTRPGAVQSCHRQQTARLRPRRVPRR